jgi:hypothetical protein
MMEGKLDLSNVSLIAITTRDYLATRHALLRSLEAARFGEVRVYTDDPFWCEPDWNIRPVEKFPAKGEPALSIFGLTQLPRDAGGFCEFTLTVHWDGFIVNPDAWESSFLTYDYIGAPWPDRVVGNSGFFWASRRFWKAIGDLNVPPESCWPGDDVICRHRRAELEAKGMRYAPWDVAHRFSVENEPYRDSFGFHGTNTLVEVIRAGRY